MNLRFVEAFYWVVSLKSVSRAAEKLFITQSAMSSRIAALEEELGVLLLDRRDKQFRLTVAGMRFHNHAQLQRKRRYTLADLAALDLLTFQRGSQPHVGLIDLFRGAGIELKRVHTISSISAMVQLVEGGFGVATLPLAAVQRLAQRLPLKPLKCEAELPPLPIHASYRDDPSSEVARGVVDAVADFVGASAAHRKKR